MGFSDRRIADLRGVSEADVASARRDAGVDAGLQIGGHLRRRIRSVHAIPLFDLRRRGRGAADRAQESDHLGRRTEPDRAGDRVRLLLRAREHGAQGRRLRNHHGELQSRDGLDRLRHFGSAVLRAADVRGRDGDCRARAAGRSDRAVRRADAAQARGAAGARGRADSRDDARCDRSRRGSRALQCDGREARASTAGRSAGARARRCGRGRGEGRLPGSDPAVVRARRTRDGSDSERRGAAPIRDAGSASLRAPSVVDRSLPARRDRSRRRCDFRRRDGGGRRNHGARRARGDPFGR